MEPTEGETPQPARLGSAGRRAAGDPWGTGVEHELKIYTRTGDAGETSLFGGRRVGKDALRVEAYGALDECNAALGMAVAAGLQGTAREWVERIQRELFRLGADLADPKDYRKREHVGAQAAAWLEDAIDRMDEELEPLRRFILPGGCPAASALHLARGICRRAERAAVRLSREEEINPELLRYLNRLSDMLFTLARWVNREAGTAEPQV